MTPKTYAEIVSSETYREFLATTAAINDDALRYFIEDFLNPNKALGKMYFTVPGGKGKHHAFEGGLAYHSVHAAKLGMKITQHYATLGIQINSDIVIAGILLHDLGKTACYDTDEDGKYVRTRLDTLLHHIPIGHVKLVMAADEWNKDKHYELRVPNETILHLQHIILSHHGRRAWSSPIIPQTTEAYIVHSIEMMDGYVEGFYSKGIIPPTIYD